MPLRKDLAVLNTHTAKSRVTAASDVVQHSPVPPQILPEALYAMPGLTRSNALKPLEFGAISHETC